MQRAALLTFCLPQTIADGAGGGATGPDLTVYDGFLKGAVADAR